MSSEEDRSESQEELSPKVAKIASSSSNAAAADHHVVGDDTNSSNSTCEETSSSSDENDSAVNGGGAASGAASASTALKTAAPASCRNDGQNASSPVAFAGDRWSNGNSAATGGEHGRDDDEEEDQEVRDDFEEEEYDDDAASSASDQQLQRSPAAAKKQQQQQQREKAWDSLTCVTRTPSLPTREVLERIAGKAVSLRMRVVGARVCPGPDWKDVAKSSSSSSSSEFVGVLLGVTEPGVAWVRWREGSCCVLGGGAAVERYRTDANHKELVYAPVE